MSSVVPIDAGRPDRGPGLPVDDEEDEARHEAGHGDRETPATGHRAGVDPALVRVVHHVEAVGQGTDQRRQEEGQDPPRGAACR